MSRTEKKFQIKFIHPHELAHGLHGTAQYFVVDCRPVFAYNSCHIAGAINVNLSNMMRKRFVAGKIGLADLVTTEEGKERFKTCLDWPTVVYDECCTDLQTASNPLALVLASLEKMGKCPYLLKGGLTEFNVLHPSLCEVNVPRIRRSMMTPVLRATTPGQRDQPLDWQTAPPVHVLSFMVLGSEKDAKSREVLRSFKIQSILNVTPKCPNYFEDQNVTYMRIAVADTGSQKLSQHFKEAFAYIEQARKNNCCILIHCMAGISRSVTLTIGYLMYHFGMSLQGAYQYVKERRPAISPNLNFMGQLVELENELKQFPSQEKLELSQFLPTSEQDKLSIRMQTYSNSSGSSAENTPEPKTTKPSFSSSSSSSSKGVLDGGVGGGGGGGTEVICTAPFVLKLPAQKHKKGIRSKKPACVTPPNITTPPLSETNSSSVSPFLEQLEQRVETAPVDSLKKLSLNI